MKRINHINYEQYALDYLEGNLEGSWLREMEMFLDENPDIRIELDEMQLLFLEPDDNIVFEGKEALIQPSGRKRPILWLGLLLLLATGLLFLLPKKEQAASKMPLSSSRIENASQVSNIHKEVEVSESTTSTHLVEKTKRNTSKKKRPVLPSKPQIEQSVKPPIRTSVVKQKNVETIQFPTSTKLEPRKPVFNRSVQPIPEPVTPQTVKEEKPIALVKPTPTLLQKRDVQLLETLSNNETEERVSFTRKVVLRTVDVVDDEAIVFEKKTLLADLGVEIRGGKNISFENIKKALTPDALVSND